jgi:hypothetical protein
MLVDQLALRAGGTVCLAGAQDTCWFSGLLLPSVVWVPSLPTLVADLLLLLFPAVAAAATVPTGPESIVIWQLIGVGLSTIVAPACLSLKVG